MTVTMKMRGLKLKTILKHDDKADYAFYGLAVLASMTGDSHTCLEHLTEAVPPESAEPDSGARRFGLSGHGR